MRRFSTKTCTTLVSKDANDGYFEILGNITSFAFRAIDLLASVLTRLASYFSEVQFGESHTNLPFDLL